MKKTKKIMILLTLIFSGILSAGLIRGHGQNTPPPNPEFSPTDDFYVRSEPRLGCRQRTYSYNSEKDCNGPDGEELFELADHSKGFVDMPRLASRLVAENDDTTVAITFSAMVTDNGNGGGGPLRLRALVDGQQANPGVVTLTERADGDAAAYSFTFIATVDKGIHTVQMQWSSEDRWIHSMLRDASLLVTVDSQDNAGQRLVAKTQKPLIPLTKKALAWSAIPQTQLAFNVPENGGAAFTFAGVSKLKQGHYFLVRAVIDNDPYLALPGATAFSNQTYHSEARSLTFTAKELSPGPHTVRFEWQSAFTNEMSEAVLEAWTVTALTNKSLTVVPQGVSFNVTSDTFTEVPTLAADIAVNELSDVAVTFSSTAIGHSLVEATVMKDGVALPEQATVLYHPRLFFAPGDPKPPQISNVGAQSFTFALKDLPPRTEPYRISVALRIQNAAGWAGAGTLVYNATMTVLRKHRLGPDLAVGANMGAASKKREAIIEPVYGKRKVLAVIFDPQRPDAPLANGGAYKQGIDDMLFGSTPSAKDYYQVVSGGRLELQKAAVLGPYTSDKGNNQPTATNHYWDEDAHSCPGVDEYSSPYAEQEAEALRKADPFFDFSAYDLDRNRVLTANELAIIIVVPQNSTFATTTLGFDPYCSGDSFVVDGVEIRELIHMYTPGTVSTPQEASGPLTSAMVAAHELAHLVLRLDDAYGPYKGIYANDGSVQPCPEGGDPACQTRFMTTAPHAISMMAHRTSTQDGGPSSPHLDGFHKLQLGWVTPRLVLTPGAYHQDDVKQSEEVFILPRQGTDAREYVLLETRYKKNVVLDPLYDYNLMDSGLAVYHVIEPGTTCKAPGGGSAPSCVPLQKPMCITSDVLWDSFTSNFMRAGLRLIQPDMRHAISAGGSTNFSDTLFGIGGLGQDLLDRPAGGGGMACPPNIGLPGGVPLLLWADGSASGYQLKTVQTDFPGQRTLFNLGITGQ